MAGYARSLAVGAARKMAMLARAIGDKTFKTGGSSLCSLFSEGAHYEKSLEAMPRARITTQPAKMWRINGSSINSDRRWSLSRRFLICGPLTASLKTEVRQAAGVAEADRSINRPPI